MDPFNYRFKLYRSRFSDVVTIRYPAPWTGQKEELFVSNLAESLNGRQDTYAVRTMLQLKLQLSRPVLRFYAIDHIVDLAE